jgi:hypothetical protein
LWCYGGCDGIDQAVAEGAMDFGPSNHWTLTFNIQHNPNYSKMNLTYYRVAITSTATTVVTMNAIVHNCINYCYVAIVITSS